MKKMKKMKKIIPKNKTLVEDLLDDPNVVEIQIDGTNYLFEDDDIETIDEKILKLPVSYYKYERRKKGEKKYLYAFIVCR